MLSRTEEYALQVVVFLAHNRGQGSLRAADLARETSCPANYCSKILHQLARHGVVDSERGRKGGFEMTRDPADLKLSEIIAPFRPQEEIGRCVLGRLECSDADPCGAHDRWKLVRRLIEEFFEGTTIADVIAGRSAKWSSPETRRSDRESPQPDGAGTAKG